jgi:hypothetical protein
VKKSVAVPLTLVATFASAIACGSSPETRQCVDGENRVVPDSLCARAEQAHPGSTGASTSVARGGGIGGAVFSLPYRYYYGGARGGLGSVVTGGGYTPHAGRGGIFSGRRSGTARGGFGGIGGGRGIGG